MNSKSRERERERVTNCFSRIRNIKFSTKMRARSPFLEKYFVGKMIVLPNQIAISNCYNILV